MSKARPESPERNHRYPGVRAFEESDREKFFGRATATEELLLRVLSVRLLLHFAPSGVGKTSLLNAGLFPKLRDHHYLPCVVRLNETTESLCAATERSLKQSAQLAQLDRPIIPVGAASLWDIVAGLQLWSHDLLLLRPVLVFDQFEEIFTLRDAAFRRDLARQLGELSVGRAAVAATGPGASTAPVPDCKIILSLREEYLGQLEELSASIPDLFHERLRLSPLTSEQARAAITAPAELDAGTWRSPRFKFDRSCLDALIDFIDGASESVKVIEPLTLQLVCKQAELLATQRAARNLPAPIELTFADFGGTAGLKSLVRSYFNSELAKLGRSRDRARDLFEQGLLDPCGKRLMLEEGEIQRRYRLGRPQLDTLVGGSLLRREPRNECVFYEISHDRLADAIASNRRTQLPRWLRPAAFVALLFMLVVSVFAYKMNQARKQAEHALGILLGEDLVSRLHTVGLSDVLPRVLRQAAIDDSSRGLALVLSLRHQGDIARDRSTLTEAHARFARALEVLDSIAPGDGSARHELLVERARLLERLGGVFESRLQLSEAQRLYVDAAGAWSRIRQESNNEQERLAAAEAQALLGALQSLLGATDSAESSVRGSLQIALNVLPDAFARMQRADNEAAFELGRAMQVYADSALTLARIWGNPPEYRGALALARESLRLHPLSAKARVQLGVAAAMYGGVLTGTDLARSRGLLDESRRQFDELTRLDPSNRRMVRQRSAVQLLEADNLAACARLEACNAMLKPEDLRAAELAVLNSLGTFRRLWALDRKNRSLAMDVAWGLLVHSKLLHERKLLVGAHLALNEAAAIYDEQSVPTDGDSQSNRLDVQLERARLHADEGSSAIALATLDEAMLQLSGLPRQASWVQSCRLRAIDEKLVLLERYGRHQEAERLHGERAALQQRIGTPWENSRQSARSLNEEASRLHERATKDPDHPETTELRQAAEKFREAIAVYPFESTYWSNLRVTLTRVDQALASKTDSAVNADVVRERERVLRESLLSAWMIKVLNQDEETSESERLKAMVELYVATRSLTMLLETREPTEEALTLVEQCAAEVEAYASQRAEDSSALSLLADANVLRASVLRRRSNNDGWEEAVRRGLAYGERLAVREPHSAAHQRWLGEWHTELARYLQTVKRDVASSEEYDLGLQCCRRALERATPKEADERAAAQHCLDALAAMAP